MRITVVWAQIWMGSNMVRADFWQQTDLPPGSNMLRRAAQTCSACKLAGVQIIPLPTLANQILARTFSRSVAHLFACRAVEKFCRASSAGGRRRLQKNFANWIVSVAEDCLSPAGSFHGCSLMHFRGCLRVCIRSSNRWLEIYENEFVDLAESGVTIHRD